MYTYTLEQWLAFFYIYCFLGWIFESAYVSFKQHRFINRGFLRLPMLPLYGSGAVMMLWVSLPFQDNLLMVYLSGVIAATALEYITGYVMERLFKVRYWDYSSKKYQIHGYICLTSSIAWGFLTILMTEIIHQPISGFVLSLPRPVLHFCTLTVTAFFALDTIESTREALALGQALETMTKLRREIEDLQERIAALREEAAGQLSVARSETAEQLSALKQETEEKLLSMREETARRLATAREETAERISSAREEAVERISSAREEAAERISSAREEAAERISSAREEAAERISSAREEAAERISSAREETAERLAQLLGQLEDVRARRRALQPGSRLRRFYRTGLLRGNPSAVSTRFSEALRELKEMAENRGKKGNSPSSDEEN